MTSGRSLFALSGTASWWKDSWLGCASFWINGAGELRLGVSHCSASHFYLLAQIKVTKTKGTLSCADASHRCPARLRPKEDSRKLAALRAAQTSGCLFLFRPPLLGATPKGTQYRQRQARYRFAMKIAKRSPSDNAEGEFGRNAVKHRNFDLAAVSTPRSGRPRLYSGPL